MYVAGVKSYLLCIIYNRNGDRLRNCANPNFITIYSLAKTLFQRAFILGNDVDHLLRFVQFVKLSYTL